MDSVEEKSVSEKSEQDDSKETDSILEESDEFKDDYSNEEFSRVIVLQPLALWWCKAALLKTESYIHFQITKKIA